VKDNLSARGSMSMSVAPNSELQRGEKTLDAARPSGMPRSYRPTRRQFVAGWATIVMGSLFHGARLSFGAQAPASADPVTPTLLDDLVVPPIEFWLTRVSLTPSGM